MLLMSFIGLNAQQGNQLYQNVQRNFKSERPAEFSLFQISSHSYRSGAIDGIEQARFLKLDVNEQVRLLQAAPTNLRLSIPALTGDGNWVLDLTRSHILSNDFKINTSDGKSYSAPEALYYQGYFNNDPSSVAVISIFQNEIAGLLSNASGNYDLGVYGTTPGTEYILYHSNELLNKMPFDCHTADGEVPVSGTAATTADCRVVRVYIECDFDLYTKRSASVSNVSTFVTAFFNQVAALYTNESIPVQISEIYVWTTTDPYISLTTSSAVLSSFRTTRTTFNGNIAHLISTRASNLGGIAYLDVLCNSAYKYAFSNISNSYNTVPTYSWTVEVFTHEMGHNLGSNHTQWCGWTGGALDNCYTTEGGCVAGPAPVGGGTIMSYCHLVSGVGINFSYGFGTQPGDKIRSRYASSTCLTNGFAVSISPANATLCSGGSINLTASGGGTYTWTPSAGLNQTTGATVAATPSSTTTYVASSTLNGCTSSASVQVSVLGAVNRGSLAPGNQSFTASGDPAAISFATVASGGAGTFTYQWYSRAGVQAAPTGTATTGWTAITGATSSSYDPGVQTASISYAVIVDPSGTPDCAGAEWASGVRQITISTSIVFVPGTLSTGNQSFCSTGGDPALISFATAPSGATSYSYQWYYQNGIIAAPTGATTTGWTAISGAITNSYDPTAGLIQSRTYACLVTPAGGTAQWASGARQITILPAFNPGTVTAGDQSFCTSGNPGIITLSSNPVGSGAYTWRWYYKESAAAACPTGSSITGWLTNSTSANISGTTLTGAGITFDPISAGSLNNGRTFAVLITPIANGSIPACGTAAWASNCRKTYVTSCATSGMLAEESSSEEVKATLGQNYPNPSSSLASIPYSLPEAMKGAVLVVYDQLGRAVQHWDLIPGDNMELDWDARFLPAGTYYYSLEFEGAKVDSKRMLLIR